MYSVTLRQCGGSRTWFDVHPDPTFDIDVDPDPNFR